MTFSKSSYFSINLFHELVGLIYPVMWWRCVCVCVCHGWQCVGPPHMQLRFQGQLKVTLQQQTGKRPQAKLYIYRPANRNHRFWMHFPLEQLLDGVACKDQWKQRPYFRPEVKCLDKCLYGPLAVSTPENKEFYSIQKSIEGKGHWLHI